ncbi:hypothetical protein C2845_PM07G03080 [Panicum miliaceum]|uniref:Bowman-Birk serine protease inhibitors family domain-containing protein n=1 Tax=Panicum miliaceum TaxID=4540 RepID=A0A3L6SH21_PANMI|nr:hypothetical protein C2845_PM07G03080 [Panicum miliaceum]
MAPFLAGAPPTAAAGSGGLLCSSGRGAPERQWPGSAAMGEQRAPPPASLAAADPAAGFFTGNGHAKGIAVPRCEQPKGCEKVRAAVGESKGNMETNGGKLGCCTNCKFSFSGLYTCDGIVSKCDPVCKVCKVVKKYPVKQFQCNDTFLGICGPPCKKN